MKNIIIIDDDDIHNFILENELTSSYQCQVQCFTDTTKATLYLKDNQPDIILLDINMRPMNGFEFLENYISNKLVNNKTKIYIISSSKHEKDINKAKTFPVITDYLVKPINYSVLNISQK